MSSTIQPGLITLHGNQLEQLRDAVFSWLADNPLGPFEQETFLVQSNGIAEWLKISLAEQMSIYASTAVTLPGRFLWRAYRTVLGSHTLQAHSPFDRSALTWRLMALLPQLDAVGPPLIFAPLRHFLQDGAPERRLQLAAKLADLYDQYQVYRADWLQAWGAGKNAITDAAGKIQPLSAEQLWQAYLWRAVIADVAHEQRHSGRTDVHQAFLAAIHTGQAAAVKLPRRIVLFGISALPLQTMEALAALSAHSQVILAVPNPCQYYWGDVISGRELLTAERRRQRSRSAQNLATVPFSQMHYHCHPLLASWGRLGRDFVRMLDHFDDAEQTRTQFTGLRIDLFSEAPGTTMLSQMHAAIRDMQPLAEHDYVAAPSDDSITFHIAHSAQREVEVLHDQLLTMLGRQETVLQKPDAPADVDRPLIRPLSRSLTPRDIIVMVPDIDTFAPAIRAVFGQYAAHDARHIPFEVVDIAERRINPLLVALDWLLRLPEQRCLQSEIRDLLDVSALATRFGIEASDLPRVVQWIDAAGIRWGLDHTHRTALDLAPVGTQNGWLFGLQRMLLGYASGADFAYAGIEPFSQIGGLDAVLVGSLASLVDSLIHWRALLAQSSTPREWGERARDLCSAFFQISEERDRHTWSTLDQRLSAWLSDCDEGGFTEAIPVAVLRDAWLGTFDEKTLNQRFITGGVTFCTMLPMRAVPYRVVCLLGMNEGDFPRRTSRADFDLLALPGMARPGDRSRRDDDRYLMLEALLSARERLYISWVGRSVHDNSSQPPSVLVSQLRDYLAAGWHASLSCRTTEHPLQPFSRRYFEATTTEAVLWTYAREWRTIHAPHATVSDDALTGLPPLSTETLPDLSLADLERFLKQPVTQFFRQRLKVDFKDTTANGDDDEPFTLGGLDDYQLDDELLADSGPFESIDQVPARLQQRAEKLAREGRLPIGHLGALWQQSRVEELTNTRSAWITLSTYFTQTTEQFPILIVHGPITINDWLDNARQSPHGAVWLEHTASKITVKVNKQDVARADKLARSYLRQLTLAACGFPLTGYLVGRDAILEFPAMPRDKAITELQNLLTLWQQGMSAPLPTAFKTALALLANDAVKARACYDGTHVGNHDISGENEQAALARLWPDYAAMEQDPQHLIISQQLYQPLLQWSHAVRVHALCTAAALVALEMESA